ncbi:MAG: hypothetical protein EAZ24_15040 [Burkholderiales bacterium]|nr:MAG: hypothetical protein EAZ24_15040 [Burkholderiales bacterium]
MSVVELYAPKTASRRYPSNWHALALSIRHAAHLKCAFPGCQARHLAVGYWDGAQFIEAIVPPLGERLVRVLIAAAHLDRTPATADKKQLMAFCQRHHLWYDRAENIVIKRSRLKSLSYELPHIPRS